MEQLFPVKNKTVPHIGSMWVPCGIYSHGIFHVGVLWDLCGILFEGWKLKTKKIYRI